MKRTAHKNRNQQCSCQPTDAGDMVVEAAAADEWASPPAAFPSSGQPLQPPQMAPAREGDNHGVMELYESILRDLGFDPEAVPMSDGAARAVTQQPQQPRRSSAAVQGQPYLMDSGATPQAQPQQPRRNSAAVQGAPYLMDSGATPQAQPQQPRRSSAAVQEDPSLMDSSATAQAQAQQPRRSSAAVLGEPSLMDSGATPQAQPQQPRRSSAAVQGEPSLMDSVATPQAQPQQPRRNSAAVQGAPYLMDNGATPQAQAQQPRRSSAAVQGIPFLSHESPLALVGRPHHIAASPHTRPLSPVSHAINSCHPSTGGALAGTQLQAQQIQARMPSSNKAPASTMSATSTEVGLPTIFKPSLFSANEWPACSSLFTCRAPLTSHNANLSQITSTHATSRSGSMQ